MTSRTLLTTVLCLLVLALAVPAAAGAHVRTKHKAEYKAQLAAMQGLFDGYARGFSQTQASIEATATAMRGMLDDPSRAAELRDLEQRAGGAYRAMTEETMPETWMAVENAFSTYLGNASRWFVSSRDRTRFTGAAATMKKSFGLLVQDALDDQSLEYQDLSQDPPDLEAQKSHGALAGGHAARARSTLRKDMTALRALL